MRNEIVIREKEAALQVVGILVEEDHCVMLSKEDDFYIINYEYAEYSNRNNVVFMNREVFDDNYSQIIDDNAFYWTLYVGRL